MTKTTILNMIHPISAQVILGIYIIPKYILYVIYKLYITTLLGRIETFHFICYKL